MSDPQAPLRPEHYFHIYNHAVGHDNLFKSNKDYNYFLQKIIEHVFPVSDILAYCLLPNHFHLVVRIKTLEETEAFFKQKMGAEKFERHKSKDENFLPEQISKRYSNLFNTYSKYYNFHYRRMGTLFKRNFRRKRIEDISYLRRLICYVHQNPVAAGFVAKPEQWFFSSYASFISTKTTRLSREEIIRLFEDLDNFNACHSRYEDLTFD